MPLQTALRRLLPFAFLYGLLSALRWPQIYTITHMVIDYRFGFGKRGLIGAILEHVDKPPYHYITLAWIAFAVFVLWLTTLLLAARQAIAADLGITAATLLFFLSAGFASLVCDVGRGEHFGLLLALPCLLMPARAILLPVRAALLCIAVLVQEANFLIIAPIVIFDVWLSTSLKNSPTRLLFTAATSVPAAILTWYLGNLQTACDINAAVGSFQHLVADFPIQPVPVGTLCLNGAANLAMVRRALWSIPAEAARIPMALVVALPSTIFNLVLTARVLRHARLDVAASIAVTFAPLALLLVGVDVVRFVTLIQLTSLLALISGYRRYGLPANGTFSTPNRLTPLIAIAALELGSTLTLNDGNPMLKFPFMPLVQQAISIGRGHTPFRVIPPY